MKKLVLAAAIAALLPVAAIAQNITTVNGKPVPKARLEDPDVPGHQERPARTPELEAKVRTVVRREIVMQEAERAGVPQSADYKGSDGTGPPGHPGARAAGASARQEPVTDELAKAEYDKFKATNSGQEYRAATSSWETEDQAKDLIKQIKAGGNFEELAKKNSKDTGSAANGGDLDFANPKNFVPEFSQAMVALQRAR